MFGSQNPGDNVSQDLKLYPFPEDIRGECIPISLIVTEFHWIVLFKNKIQAINQLDEKIVWEEYFADPTLGTLKGITKDPKDNTSIWVFSQYKVLELRVDTEDRDIWRVYLDKHDYQQAVRFCKTDVQKDIVLTAQADTYFENGNYALAARFYGATTKSFEEITLKFIRLDDRDALKTYLLEKLQNLSPGVIAYFFF